jgi:alanine dehydrogenase
MSRANAFTFIDAAELDRLLEPRELVAALRAKLREGECEMPVRHHHAIHGCAGVDGTLLLMPAWQRGRFLGLKSITVYPANSALGLPTLMGFYVLINAQTGELLAFMDAAALTAHRTAAASALAATFLAREDASRLLMIGTGALAPYMIRAHAATRPISHVAIYGRVADKAERMAALLANNRFATSRARDIEVAVGEADIICCATTANEPVLRGAWLKAGAHVDLVGAYMPNMREGDTDVIVRAKVYVDGRAGALREAGDILIPLRQGAIKEDHIAGDLFELTRDERAGRTSATEITLFKSVGMALEDLAAAELAFCKHEAAAG